MGNKVVLFCFFNHFSAARNLRVHGWEHGFPCTAPSGQHTLSAKVADFSQFEHPGPRLLLAGSRRSRLLLLRPSTDPSARPSGYCSQLMTPAVWVARDPEGGRWANHRCGAGRYSRPLPDTSSPFQRPRPYCRWESGSSGRWEEGRAGPAPLRARCPDDTQAILGISPFWSGLGTGIPQRRLQAGGAKNPQRHPGSEALSASCSVAKC